MKVKSDVKAGQNVAGMIAGNHQSSSANSESMGTVTTSPTFADAGNYMNTTDYNTR